MLKRLELTHPQSCLNRAEDDEYLFVLLARDETGPSTVRYWIEERIRIGKNKRGDAQIVEAELAAREMEEFFRKRKAAKGV